MASSDRKSSQTFVVPGSVMPRPPYVYIDEGGVDTPSEPPIAGGPTKQSNAASAMPVPPDDAPLGHRKRAARCSRWLMTLLESDVMWLLMVSLVIAAAASLSA